MLKLGNERPVASLDVNSAKLVLAQSHDIQTATLKGVGKMDDKGNFCYFSLSLSLSLSVDLTFSFVIFRAGGR